MKLLQFALRVASASAFAKELTDDADALRQAIRPLVMNPDCHFLAVLTVLVQSILEGRTDCPISGVFGAGKTRAAAAMIAGLLVMDPTLKVMVVTKENAAAHAFAKHIESLQLPPSLEEKFGRLVGATELEKGPASQTKLDIVPGYRNTVLRTKQVISGGGFHQECTQPYSPVARWMADVDVALNDEGQQYGNLDEASAIARIPRKGIVIWCGDHKQTPGGLRKSEEARVFRRKLMRTPIALRGDATFLPPHMLGAIVHPYVKDVPGPQMAGLSQLLPECTKQPLGLSTGSVNVFQDLCKETIGGCWVAGITSCCCAAIAVLWLALAPERFPLQADTFSCAAGTAGKQKWSLILPSSARVSELTYNTIIGTRYPELDNVQNDIIQFGNYLQAEQCTRGGFIPIFWDAPYSYIQACTDIGEVVDWITDKFVVHNKGDLAVLHNRNKMVNTFTNTEWVSGSGGAIISRSVTSCAGMTAFLVLLAQTRVGFLSGGRGKSFHQLPAQEQASQKEEAYARATVALARAQQICFIMGPLDMQGLVGAATIIGCLKYGASFSGLDEQEDLVFLIRLKDDDLLESPDDSAFLQSLRFSCARVNGVYPPLALVEAYITEEDSAPKVRRLHLIVVDLHRRRRMADRVLRLLVDLQVDRCAEECLHTLPIPWKQNQEAYQLRYVFGYAMEGSDLPCYILWPERTAEQSFWCIDAWKGDWVRLDTCAYMAPLGIEHFFDAFCFNPQRPWGAAAIQALGIPSCRVSKDAYLENMQRSTFSLTPRRIPTERKREVDQDMVAKEERVSEVGSDADSGWSGVSDNSSTDSECTGMEASSIASDQDRFDTAYEALQDLANDLYYIDLTRYSRGSTSEDAAGVLLVDGYEKLQEMVRLPRTWPLARLTIPLEGLSKQIDRLLEGYCFQILATNQYPEAHNGKVLQTATHLTWILAEYLSDTIAWLMRSILSHESKILFDKDTQLLLTPKFWLLPLYRELLNSARRIRPSPASERARGCTGLVKVICKENKEQKGKRKYHAGTPHPNDRGGFPQWFGSCSLMTTLHVWFPAAISGDKCGKCGSKKHSTSACTVDLAKIKCFSCGGSGHIGANCPNKRKGGSVNQGDKWSKGKGDAKGQGGKSNNKGKGKGKGKAKGFGKKGKLNETIETDPVDLWYEEGDWWFDADWNTWVTSSMYETWDENAGETTAQADGSGEQTNSLIISMMHVDVDEIGDTGLFLEDSGLDEGLPSVSELSHGSMHVVPQPFGQGSCSGRGSKKRCKSVICGCVECVEEGRRFSSAWSTHRMRIHERNSKGLVSGEKLVSGDGIGNVGMSSSSKVSTCWSGFCGLKGPEGFCEGSGDLVSQFRGRLTVFKTKFGTFLNDCDTCSKFSQFVRYSSVVMPLLSQMSMDDSSWWLLDSGASATVLAERFATSYGVPRNSGGHQGHQFKAANGTAVKMSGKAEVGVRVVMVDEWGTKRSHRNAQLKAMVGDIQHNIISTTSLCKAGWEFWQGDSWFELRNKATGEVASEVGYFAGCPWIRLQSCGPEGAKGHKVVSFVGGESEGSQSLAPLTKAAESALQQHRLHGPLAPLTRAAEAALRQHRLQGHVPYDPRCLECSRGRTTFQHRRRKENLLESELQADFAFMSSRGELTDDEVDHGYKVLVLSELSSNCVGYLLVTSDLVAVRSNLVKWLDHMGLSSERASIVLHTDSERAVSELVTKASDRFVFIVRRAAPQQHRSVGHAERAVRRLKESLAVVRSDLNRAAVDIAFSNDSLGEVLTYLGLSHNHYGKAPSCDLSPLEFVAGRNLSKPVTAMYGMNVLAEIPQSLRQGSPNEARNVEACFCIMDLVQDLLCKL